MTAHPPVDRDATGRRPDARRLAATVLALLCSLLAACGGRAQVADSFPCYFHPGIAGVQRIAVCPLHRAKGVGNAATAVDRGMPASWRELGLFEVINLTAAERDALMPEDALHLGRVPPDALRGFRDAFRVDAVLIGRIEQLESYDPVSVALEAALIDCGDGTVLWTASGHFDSRRAEVQDDVRAWHGATVGDAQQSIAGWRITLSSPGLFSRYVCDRLAHSVLNAPGLKGRNSELAAAR